MGIIEIRRLTLVLCSVFISDKVLQFMAMSTISMLAFSANILVQPFKDRTVNIVSGISLFCQVVVGIISSRLAWGDLEDGNQSTILFVLYMKEISTILPLPCLCFIFCFQYVVRYFLPNFRKWKIRKQAEVEGHIHINLEVK